uniref:Uncharacterized protein n=1 Tax=Bionectria ochroleuca TaxID=29856 RepID=A0A0B7K570_BIOOC
MHFLRFISQATRSVPRSVNSLYGLPAASNTTVLAIPENFCEPQHDQLQSIIQCHLMIHHVRLSLSHSSALVHPFARYSRNITVGLLPLVSPLPPYQRLRRIGGIAIGVRPHTRHASR